MIPKIYIKHNSNFQLFKKSLHNTATAPAGQLEKLAATGSLGSPGSSAQQTLLK